MGLQNIAVGGCRLRPASGGPRGHVLAGFTGAGWALYLGKARPVGRDAIEIQQRGGFVTSSRWAAALFAAGVVAVPGLSRADGVPDRAIAGVDNSISLSFRDSHVGYGERLSGPSSPYFNTEDGFLPGGQIAVSGLNDDVLTNLYMRLAYSHMAGHLGYNGAYLNTNVALMKPHAANMTDWSFRLGQGFVTGEHALLTPYLTFGSHDWVRGSSALGDYTERYSNKYLGGGFLFQVAATRRLVMSVNLAYAETLRAQIDVQGTSYPYQEGLGSSPWERAGLSIDYRISNASSFFLGATYTTFRYGQGASIPTTPGMVEFEPYSKTAIVNYDVGVRIFY